MTYSLHFINSAEIELMDAYNYYEGKVEGLGVRFLKSAEKSLILILNSPEVYAVKKAPFRSCPIKDFPYLIFYAIIVVYSIFNTAQDTAKWP